MEVEVRHAEPGDYEALHRLIGGSLSAMGNTPTLIRWRV